MSEIRESSISATAPAETHPTSSLFRTPTANSPTNRPQFHSFSTGPTEPLDVPTERPNRKVSFSDVVVTSSRVEKRAKLCADPADSAEGTADYFEQIRVEEHPVDDASDDAGHPIEVLLIENVAEDDNLCGTPLVNATAPVYEVRLGMLKQRTVYRIEFLVPDELGPSECELLRYTSDVPGQMSSVINVGAKLDLTSCESASPDPGHRLCIQMATTELHRVSECFTMRLIDRPEALVHLHLHGLSLGRGQGTPFLRVGIHRVRDNPDYEDSDEFTEWPGFVPPTEEDDEDDGPEAETSGRQQPRDNPVAMDDGENDTTRSNQPHPHQGDQVNSTT